MALVANEPPSASTIPDPHRYRAAGFFRRTAATLVDLLVLCPVFFLLGALLCLVSGRSLPRLRELGPDLLVSALLEGSAMTEALLVLCLLLLLLYFFVFHSLRGQTPGKRLLGLAVIDVYGERPGFFRTFLRTSSYVISAVLFLLGFLWIGFDREKRGLHDWIAGTYVVHAR